jgi:antitoxin (DNA-binding transcriptional repressor) of toxin-antitoxin stability system
MMKTMTVRDIRLKWPDAERQLVREGEITVTRDGKPVARLLTNVPPAAGRRKRWNPEAHVRWLRRFWATQPAQPPSEPMLAADRADRPL